MASLVVRFLEKVDVTPGQCWEWQSTRHGKGYGHFRIGDRVEKAHRVSYELFVGPVASPLQVLHGCDNPACVNPDHLWLGTNEDNLADRQAKGRQARGSRNAKAKLTEHQVRQIRELSARVRGDYGEIARRFGVSESTVKHIAYGRTWKHLLPNRRRGQQGDGECGGDRVSDHDQDLST